MQLNTLVNNKFKTMALGMLAVIFAFALQMALAPKAHATTYNVNTLSDPTGCGFIEALAEVSGSPVPGATCAASDADDTINIAPSATPYALTTDAGSVSINGNLTIDGGNATQTIIDGSGFAGFTLAGSGNYTLKNVTLTNFQSNLVGQSMLIYIGEGSLNVDHIIAHNNTCTAFDPDTGSGTPVCSLLAKIFPGNSTMTVSNSAFYNNDAGTLFGSFIIDVGAGTPGNGEFNMFNNTVYNNKGTIYSMTNLIEGATLTANIYNNTFYKNTPYGEDPGIIVNGGDGTFEATLNMRNNIIAETGGSGNCPAAVGANGALLSNGGNISDDASCDSYFSLTNDKNSTTPLLGDFTATNNTWVLPLLAASPALENAVAGAPTTPSTDQRGVARPQGSASDSGAYEYVYPTPGLPNTGIKTGLDAKTSVIIVGLIVLAGISIAGYSLKRR